jgi:hypothetical protein
VLSSFAAPAVAGAVVSLPSRLSNGSAVDVVVPIRVEPADGLLALDLEFVFDPGVLAPRTAYTAPLTAGMTL